eukprot:UN01339
MYKNLKYMVKVGNQVSDEGSQKIGIKQGCTISPLLFIIYFNQVCVELRKDMKKYGHLEWTYLELLFADDIAIVATSEEQLEQMMTSITRGFSMLQLKMNEKKTEVMLFSHELPSKQSLQIKHVDQCIIQNKQRKSIKTNTNILNNNDDSNNGNKSNNNNNNNNNDNNNNNNNNNKNNNGHKKIVISTYDCLKYPSFKKDVELNVVEYYKYLGYNITQDLTPDVANANKLLFIIKKEYENLIKQLPEQCTTTVLPKLINTYVLPRLLANAPIYGLLLNTTTIMRRKTMQIINNVNKFIQSINKIPNTTNTILQGTAQELQSGITGIIDPYVYTEKLAVTQLMTLIEQQENNMNEWLYKYLNKAIPTTMYSKDDSRYDTPIIATLRYIMKLATQTRIYYKEDDKKPTFKFINYYMTLPYQVRKVMLYKGIVYEDYKKWANKKWINADEKGRRYKPSKNAPEKPLYDVINTEDDEKEQVICIWNHLDIKKITLNDDICLIGKETKGKPFYQQMLIASIQNRLIIELILKNKKKSIRYYIDHKMSRSNYIMNKLQMALPYLSHAMNILNLIKQRRIGPRYYNKKLKMKNNKNGQPIYGGFSTKKCICGKLLNNKNLFNDDKKTNDETEVQNQWYFTTLNHVLHKCKSYNVVRDEALQYTINLLKSNKTFEFIIVAINQCKILMKKMKKKKNDMIQECSRIFRCMSEEKNDLQSQDADRLTKSDIMTLIESPQSNEADVIRRCKISQHYNMNFIKLLQKSDNNINMVSNKKEKITRIMQQKYNTDIFTNDEYYQYTEWCKYVEEHDMLYKLFKDDLDQQKDEEEGKNQVKILAVKKDYYNIIKNNMKTLIQQDDKQLKAQEMINPRGSFIQQQFILCYILYFIKTSLNIIKTQNYFVYKIENSG